MEVEMKIRGLMVDPSTNMPVVILKDPNSDTVLPIWVGLYEAQAIQLEVMKATTPRPYTHDLLKNVVAELPRDREIVIYCGCCPWDKCPNVQPATDALKELGFTRVRVLHLPDNFKTNWIDKGYPVE